MRNPNNVFHLAIPCKSLKETEDFYLGKLGVKLARRYDDRITLDFFGDQIVCHLCPEKIDLEPEIYPRHFGITFKEKFEFDNLLKLIKARKIGFFKKPFTRFKGKPEEHSSFFIKDPSNNLIEIKYYKDSRMMY